MYVCVSVYMCQKGLCRSDGIPVFKGSESEVISPLFEAPRSSDCALVQCNAARCST